MKRITYILVCLLILSLQAGLPQPRSQMFVGARPLGLGEAFVAIADDGNAAYWNPAGLPTLKRLEFNTMYARLYNITGLSNMYLSFVYPLTPRYVLAASYFHVGFDDNELEFFRNKAYLSCGARVYRGLFVGGNLKYINTDARLDGVSEGKASGLGFDFGALYTLLTERTKFLRQVNAGLMLHDIGGTRITYASTDNSETILPQNLRLGFTLYPPENISLKWFSLNNSLLAFDFDDRFHLGAETFLSENLGFRFGFQKDFNTAEAATYALGGSIKFPYVSVKLDYAYVIPPTLSPTHIFSLSFIPSPSPIKITDLKVDDIFASFYKSYAIAQKIGSVTVRNDYDRELKLTMSVDIPHLTESSTQQNFVLRPGERRIINFSAIFSPLIMEIKELEFRQVKVRVSYQVKNENKYVEASKKFRLYGRGALTWETPAKAVAFITKLDRMVELFAREVTRGLPYKSELELGNLYLAAALFDALGAAGIQYRRDPENPFSIIPRTQHCVDHIQYPAELLISKQGECDDLTVLYAALLEYCGIPTALLSTENHIWLMFDTGIHEKKWGLLPLGDSLVVRKNKTLWIPVEVTAVGRPFVAAWSDGGKKYREAEQEGQLEVVLVKEAEGIYLSALPPELQQRIPDLPPMGKYKKSLNKDFIAIEQLRSQEAINNCLTKLKKQPRNIEIRNRLGIILAQQNFLDRAEHQFRTMLVDQPQNAQAHINLANVLCMLGKFKLAENHYLQAITTLSNAPGLYLNLAIMYQLWKIKQPALEARLQNKSEKNLLYAFSLLKGDEEKALDLLGITDIDSDLGEKADFRSWVKQQAATIKKFIKRNAKKYLFNKSIKGAHIERKAVKRGVDKDRSYILWWAESLEH